MRHTRCVELYICESVMRVPTCHILDHDKHYQQFRMAGKALFHVCMHLQYAYVCLHVRAHACVFVRSTSHMCAYGESVRELESC